MAMIDYFANCKTPEEAKTEFRKLAMQHHPDKGGNAEVFKTIMQQYKDFSVKANNGNTQRVEIDMKEMLDWMMKKGVLGKDVIQAAGIALNFCGISVFSFDVPVTNKEEKPGEPLQIDLGKIFGRLF